MLRTLVVALALVVSPLGATICEVVCGSPAVLIAAETPEVAAVVESEAHAHHGHHAAPPPATEQTSVVGRTPGTVRVSIPAPECDLRAATPARLRQTSTDFSTSPVAETVMPLACGVSIDRAVPRATAIASPPAPPLPAPVPLRI